VNQKEREKCDLWRLEKQGKKNYVVGWGRAEKKNVLRESLIVETAKSGVQKRSEEKRLKKIMPHSGGDWGKPRIEGKDEKGRLDREGGEGPGGDGWRKEE